MRPGSIRKPTRDRQRDRRIHEVQRGQRRMTWLQAKREVAPMVTAVSIVLDYPQNRAKYKHYCPIAGWLGSLTIHCEGTVGRCFLHIEAGPMSLRLPLKNGIATSSEGLRIKSDTLVTFTLEQPPQDPPSEITVLAIGFVYGEEKVLDA